MSSCRGRFVFRPQSVKSSQLGSFLLRLVAVVAASNDAIALRKMAALYQGAYLEGADANWLCEIEIERQRLERLYVGALCRPVAQLD
jgi:two-component SAPR family response regulator